ncbi:matrixin family metalloprotease [Lactobacillus sp. ESL0731]|uniref:matrixin family metalloprotease n=1 Tax=unclassified Lactobacillus TaxID=2620435 RepID=UPI0023F6D220|nr:MULTISPECIES: matrixin family metalloprotease [unclassified Lactobacillus]WEV50615.1 matrixin family metalloprotease [Lactobacillus sp. ESL0700]WEV61745.1 matrixin family metalloprotease [Lactobacillus sp. ESL0731]
MYEYNGSDLIKQDYYNIKQTKKFKYNLRGKQAYNAAAFTPQRNNLLGYSWPDKNNITYTTDGTARQAALTDDSVQRINSMNVVKLTPTTNNPDITVHYVSQEKINSFNTDPNHDPHISALGLTIYGNVWLTANKYAPETFIHVNVYVNKDENHLSNSLNSNLKWRLDYRNESIIIHEFGHALGLDHTSGYSNLMSSSNYQFSQTATKNHTQILDQDFYNRLKTLYTAK